MNTWSYSLPYFSLHELACKGTGVSLVDVRFAAVLPCLREKWGGPLTPTSVCRTPSHNKSVGGHPSSLHLTQNPRHSSHGAMAADILWANWSVSHKIDFVRLAWGLGLSVGLHDTFCHVDLRAAVGLPQSVFIYGQWSGDFGREVLS